MNRTVADSTCWPYVARASVVALAIVVLVFGFVGLLAFEYPVVYPVNSYS